MTSQNSFSTRRVSHNNFSKSYSKDLKLAPSGNSLLRAPVQRSPDKLAAYGDGKPNNLISNRTQHSERYESIDASAQVSQLYQKKVVKASETARVYTPMNIQSKHETINTSEVSRPYTSIDQTIPTPAPEQVTSKIYDNIHTARTKRIHIAEDSGYS